MTDHTDQQCDHPGLRAAIYLFVIQQTISRRETDVMVGFQFRGLAVVVELKTRRSQGGLQHLGFPVVDGDLQVIDVRLHR